MAMFGDLLIVVGIAMLLLVPYFSYQILSSLPENPNFAISTSSTNSTLETSASDLSNNLSLVAYSGAYVFIKILVLFLFASVGYKLASLGMTANRDRTRESRAKEQTKKSKGTWV